MFPVIFIASALLVVLVLNLNTWRIYSAIRTLFRGDYQEAVNRFDRILQRRLSNKLRGISLCNKAIGQHRLGLFNESTTTLAQIDHERLDGNLKSAFYGLHGANLLLLESDLPTAKEYLEKAFVHTGLSSYLPSLAYCELLLGNTARADELVGDYLDKNRRHKRVVWGRSTLLVTDKAFARCMNDYFLGCYFVKKGEVGLAKQYFTQSAEFRSSNIFSEKARGWLGTVP